MRRALTLPGRLLPATALSLGLALGPGCSSSFPGGSPGENMIAALLVFGNFNLTPSPLSFLAAGATYKFTLSGGVGAPTYTYSDCAGNSSSINATTGLFQAPRVSATCLVAATDGMGSSRSATVTVQTYGDLVKRQSGLYAYYPLDGNATDASTNALVATPVGAPTFSAGGAIDPTVYSSNQSMSLSGADAQTAITGFDPSVQAATGFSAELWFRIVNADVVVSGAALPLISQESCGGGTPRIWLGIDANGQDEIMTQIGGTTNRSGIKAKTNKTYHAVVTVKGTALNLYVNGVLRKSTTVVPETCSAVNPFAIGRFGGAFYTGFMDEVALYQSELSATDVSRHYLAGLAKTMAVDDISVYALYGSARTFQAVGGVPPHTYADTTTLIGDSINTASGLYTPPSLASSSAAEATETITATDSAGNTASLAVTVAAFPNSFPTLQAWFTAESVTDKIDAANVPILFDISNTGMNLVNIPGTKPTFMRPSAAMVNNYAALQFVGVPDELDSTTGFGTAGDLTVFVLAFTGNNMILLSHDDVGAAAADNINYQLAINAGNLVYTHQSNPTAVQSANSAGPVPIAAWTLLGMRRTNSAGLSTVAVYVDGTSTTSAAFNQPFDGSNGKLHLGLATGVTHTLGMGNFSGRIAELAIFHRGLADSEIKQLTCYFKIKYNLLAVGTICP